MIAKQFLGLKNLTSAFGRFKFSTEAYDEASEQVRTPKPKFKKAAIILSGVGTQDGTEVTEVVALMVHLNKMYVDFQCFAPNQNQLHVVNHATGEVTQETRNVLVESARIARGGVKDISELRGEDYQAILFPGGFGVAKNLSDYAVNGGSFNVHEEVARVLREFHSLKKPIGAMCISPVLLAKVFSNEKPKITLGRTDLQDSTTKYWPHSAAIGIAESLGAHVLERNNDKFQIDFDNRIVTTPAFMFDGFTKYSTTFDGAGSLCQIIEQIVLGNPINVDQFITSKDRRNTNTNTNSTTSAEGEQKPYYRERRQYNNNSNYNNNRNYENNNANGEGNQNNYRRRNNSRQNDNNEQF